MDIIEVKQKALVMDLEELTKMRFMFDYLYHRTRDHLDCPVATEDNRKFIIYVRLKLKEL